MYLFGAGVNDDQGQLAVFFGDARVVGRSVGDAFLVVALDGGDGVVEGERRVHRVPGDVRDRRGQQVPADRGNQGVHREPAERPLVDEPQTYPTFLPVPEEHGTAVVDLGEDTVLMSADAPRTAELFRGRGLQVVTVAISEFEKLEGCVTCLSVRLR